MKITFKDGIVIEVKETEGKTKKEIMDEVKIIHKEFKDSQSVKDTIINLDQLEEGQSVKLIEDIPYDSIEEEDLEEWSRDYGEDFDKVFIKGEFEGKPYALIPKGSVITLKQLNGPAGGWPCFEINGIEVDFCGELGDYKGILINEFKDECSVKDSENDELATIDDWDEFYEDIFPREIKYEDLDIDVVAERVDYSYKGHNEWFENDWEQPGVIREWYYDLDKSNKDTNELVAKFYKKGVNQITKQDLLNLKDNKKFDDFLYEAFYEEACEDAEKNWEEDDVDWDDYDKGDYDMDHYEDI